MTDAIDFMLPQPVGGDMQTLTDYNATDWEYGGGRPAAYQAADGSWLWGTLEKIGGSAGTLKLVVYHVSTSGALISAWPDSGIIGQGGLCLQGNGQLYAVGYIAYGDNATMRAVPVPGWVAWPAAQGPAGPQGPMGPAGPKGDPGPAGPAGSGGSLDAEQSKAVAWLVRLLRRLEIIL